MHKTTRTFIFQLAQVLNLEQKTQKPSMHVRLRYIFQTKDFKTCQLTFLGFFCDLLSILQVHSLRFTKSGSGSQTGSRKLLLQTLTRFEFQQKVLGRVWDKRTKKTWLSSSKHCYWHCKLEGRGASWIQGSPTQGLEVKEDNQRWLVSVRMSMAVSQLGSMALQRRGKIKLRLDGFFRKVRKVWGY